MLGDAGLAPVELAEKEGLALINGTDGMLGMLILALEDGHALLQQMDIAAVALHPGAAGDRPGLHERDPRAASAPRTARQCRRILSNLLADSPIVVSHVDDITQVQDAYSLRCAPQVHGAARDTFSHAQSVADIELASRDR